MNRRTVLGAILTLLLLMGFASPVLGVTPVVKNVCYNNGATTSTLDITSCTIFATGDVIAVFVNTVSTLTTTAFTVSSVTSTAVTGGFTQQGFAEAFCVGSDGPTFCGGAAAGNQPIITTLLTGLATSSGGSQTMHIIFSGTASIVGAQMFDMNAVNSTTPGIVSKGICNGQSAHDCGNPMVATSTGFAPGISLELSSAATRGNHPTSATTGYSFVGSTVDASGGEFSTTATSVSTPTSFGINFSTGSGLNSGYAMLGAVFGVASGPGAFSCSIKNMDAGNYLVASSATFSGKFYQFACEVKSNAINPVNARIADVRIQFNDSVHVITLEYVNDTVPLFLIKNGSSYANLVGGPVISAYNAGVRTLNVTFQVQLTQNVLDASGRGIQLFALNDNFQTRGYEYVQTDYFNIMNKGGGVTRIVHGLCSQPAGADTFQALCQYQASPKSWIAINSTWFQLQQFQGLFSIKLANNYGNPDDHLWQSYAESGSGANNSTNPGDWKIDLGLYTWDNSSSTCCWVKGIHATISMLTGRQGTNNQWTEFKVGFFDGSTLLSNQTFVGWIEQNPLSQVTLWVNFWYSQNNASMSEGGRVAAYYTGMKNSGFLWWSSWSPLIQNDTAAEQFVPLKDHTGAAMPSSLAQFTKVYMNMSRPGAPNQHTGQPNFQVITRAFQIASFGTTQSAMGSIDNPSFAAAVVPQIQNTGFFSPLIRALSGLGNLIVNGLSYIGQTIWAGLGSKFPWFTNFWSSVAGLTTSAFAVLSQSLGYFIGFLGVITKFFGPVATIIGLIGSAWATIQGIYLPIFKGANLSAMITIAVLWIFSGWVLENAEQGNTSEFMRGATVAWRAFSAILNITWMFAKFIIDGIEGLIP